MKGKLLCIFLVVLVAQAHVTQASLLGNLLGGITGVVNTLTSSVVNLLNGILTSAQNLISGALTNVGQLATKGVNDLTGLVTGVTTAAGTTLTGALATVETLLSNATGVVTGIVENVAQSADSILTTIPAALTDSKLLDGVQQAIANLTSTLDGSGLTDTLVALPAELLSKLSQIMGGVSTTLANALSSLPTLISDLISSLLSLVEGIVGKLPTANDIAKSLDTIQTLMAALPADISNKIKTAVAAGDTALTNITTPITATLNATIKPLLAEAETLANSLVDTIKGLENSTEAVKTIVADKITQLATPLLEQLSGCPAKATDAIAALTANATAAATSCVDELTATFTTSLNQLVAGITAIKSDVLNLNLGAVTNVSTAITNSALKVAQVPTTLAACLSNLGTNVVQDATPLLTSLTC